MRGRAQIRAGLVFGVSFGALLGLLLARNHRVFTMAVYERGDAAANSIITDQAMHFELLVGNYSRLGFSHPGPAFFYWQALGRWLLYEVSGLAPAPWNGQWLALLVLNAALVAATLTILWSWSARWPAVVLCGAAALCYFAWHPHLLSSAWMPYLYLAPFLLLLTAASSVAAGRTAHLWALALAGGLLVHGHAEFLFFVPVIAAATLVALWLRRRRRPDPAGAARHWWLGGAVVAAFLLPMVLNVALHWPGELGKYVSYGDARGLHGAGATAGYVLRFWAAGPVTAVALAAGAFAAVAVLASRCPPGPERQFLTTGLAVAGLATALFAVYAARGIDNLGHQYVGFFYRAVPLFLLLLAALGLATVLGAAGAAPAWWSGWRPRAIRWTARVRTIRLPLGLRTVRLPWWLRSTRFGALRIPGPAPVLAVAALVVAGAVAVRSPALITNPEHLPELPRVIEAVAGYTRWRPAVVELDRGSWPALTALIVQGDQRGQRVCARDPGWRFLVTAEFICTPADLRDGRPLLLSAQPPPGAPVLAELDGSVLVAR